ncbi:MAG: hypothetical protein U0931_00010 [Vulcanimicrobiota bacterium]
MSKHAIIGIIVLCFVSTFMTMLYQYASRGYAHETFPPPGPDGHHSVHASGGHEGAAGHEPAPAESATPGPAVETPMSMEPPAPLASETPAAATATPVATATP